MALVAQATFVGPDVIIKCNPKWDCCQREQAQLKVNQMNEDVQAMKSPGGEAGSLIKTDVQMAALLDNKDTVCAQARAAMDRKTPEERAKGVKPDCLAEKLKKNTRSAAHVEMDHRLDTKWGGPSAPAVGDLAPVDSRVNGALGTFAKNVGNDMRAAGEYRVASFSLDCPRSPPGCPGPGKGHGAGEKKEFPKKPKNKVRSRKFGKLPKYK
jgi:hypothetical protein